jgi:UPF0716 protein FxsA
MAKSIIAAILLLPLAEIVAFIAVAMLVGLGPAVLLMLATTLAGFLVLRRAGRSGLAGLRGAMGDGRTAGAGSASSDANAGGLLVVLAGVLLFVPGFLTDLAGAALLCGPVRRYCGGAVRRWLRRSEPADRSTVDLAPDEWTQVTDDVSDRELSNHSGPRGRD